MRKQFKMILIVALILLIVVFAVLNIQSVAINFGFGELKLPMIVMLILWILVGALINFLISTSSSFSQRRANKQISKKYDAKVDQLQSQVVALQKQLKTVNQDSQADQQHSKQLKRD